jgi:hypothetical protein
METLRFNRPSYASRATPSVECAQPPSVNNNNQGQWSRNINYAVPQQPQFSTPKTVAERLLIKPFGKAVDTIQNKNITTYGEDVFIEYNPMVFIGKKGLSTADTYLKNVIQSYAKKEPVTEIIILKSEFAVLDIGKEHSYLKNINEIEKQDNRLDWWGDDNINDKINAQTDTFNINSEYKNKLSITELVPEVIDKLHIANKLINDMTSQIPRSLDVIKFRTLPTHTGNNKAAEARFAPVRRKIDNNTDKQNNDNLNHIDFGDNFSIRISNFSNPDELTTYAIKDILYEYIGDIKFKVSIPRNKETNQNKDFAFINFISEADLHKAFELLTAQRIFMDSAILYVEVSKRRSGY